MKREELIYLKKRLQEEKEKRDKIKNLLQQDNVKELISLIEISPDLFIKEDYELLKIILKNYKITNTNNIYVATKALVINWGHSYETYIDSFAFGNGIYTNGSRIYTNIEDKSIIKAWINTYSDDNNRIITTEFERENIVLNPYNTSVNENGFEEVRQEFFENAIKYGQAKSKKLLLRKYPRL